MFPELDLTGINSVYPQNMMRYISVAHSFIIITVIQVFVLAGQFI